MIPPTGCWITYMFWCLFLVSFPSSSQRIYLCLTTTRQHVSFAISICPEMQIPLFIHRLFHNYNAVSLSLFFVSTPSQHLTASFRLICWFCTSCSSVLVMLIMILVLVLVWFFLKLKHHYHFFFGNLRPRWATFLAQWRHTKDRIHQFYICFLCWYTLDLFLSLFLVRDCGWVYRTNSYYYFWKNRVFVFWDSN